MENLEKEIKNIYELCGISSEIENHEFLNFNRGILNNKLHLGNELFSRNSAFSYSACGASSVGNDWFNENGLKN